VRTLCTFTAFVHGRRAHRTLPSFPTRRSSDLYAQQRGQSVEGDEQDAGNDGASPVEGKPAPGLYRICRRRSAQAFRIWIRSWSRSEEHTSELQSPCNLVCRLLLEKKNYRRVQW